MSFYFVDPSNGNRYVVSEVVHNYIGRLENALIDASITLHSSCYQLTRGNQMLLADGIDVVLRDNTPTEG